MRASADGMVRPCTCPASDGNGRAALHRKFAANVAEGHSRPSHFVPVLNNVRYASDSDHSRYESELTLWASNGHLSLPPGSAGGVV